MRGSASGGRACDVFSIPPFPGQAHVHFESSRSARSPRPLVTSVFAFALVVGALVGPATRVHAAPAPPMTAAGFKLPGREGVVDLAAFRGKVVYLDFWASWCGPCRASFPWMTNLARTHAADSLVVIAVNLDKDRALADAFLVEHPAGFRVAFDPSGRTAEAYKVSAMPTSFLIGRDGTVLLRHAGFDARRTADVERRIVEALRP